MSVTVADILHLDIMKDFKILAGSNGLSNTIKCTEILDFEFLEEGENYRKVSFYGDSIVLSSLLFAKDKPELVLDAIKKLIGFNVHALAYKPVIYKELPNEVLEYADKVGFPILEFGKDEFFEDVIFEIQRLNKIDENVEVIETLIEDMVERDYSQKEANEVWEKINPMFRPYVETIFIKTSNEGRIEEIIKRANIPSRMQNKTFIGKYKDCFIIILSQDEDDEMKFQVLYEDVINTYGIKTDDAVVGISNIRSIYDSFDITIKEGYWACKIAKVENNKICHYRNLGIYQFIISQINSRFAIDYMENYLRPLFEDDDKDSELLKTAICYVNSRGDVNEAADKMFCHKNTIRYRIGKIAEKIDNKSSEKEFYQNLSVAIKIYLLKNE